MFSWDSFVDVVTIFWLGIFVVGELYVEYAVICGNINLTLLSVFVADLLFKYWHVRDLKVFFRKHWFDILVTVPYFRVLRLLRLVKTAKTVKTTHLTLGKIEKYYKLYRKLKRL